MYLSGWTMTRDEETGNYTLTCLNDNFNLQEKKIQVNCGNRAMTGDLIVDVKAKKGALSNSFLDVSPYPIVSTSEIDVSITNGNKLRMNLHPQSKDNPITPSRLVSTEGWITNNNSTENTFYARCNFNDSGSVYFYFEHTSGVISDNVSSRVILDTTNDRNKDFIVISHGTVSGSSNYNVYIKYKNVGDSQYSTINNPFNIGDIGGGIFYKENVGWVYRKDFQSASSIIGTGNLDYLEISTRLGVLSYEIVKLVLGDKSVD